MFWAFWKDAVKTCQSNIWRRDVFFCCCHMLSHMLKHCCTCPRMLPRFSFCLILSHIAACDLTCLHVVFWHHLKCSHMSAGIFVFVCHVCSDIYSVLLIIMKKNISAIHIRNQTLTICHSTHPSSSQHIIWLYIKSIASSPLGQQELYMNSHQLCGRRSCKVFALLRMMKMGGIPQRNYQASKITIFF